MPELAGGESVADVPSDGSSCSIELKSLYPGDEADHQDDDFDGQTFRGVNISDEELNERIQTLYDKRKEVGVLNLSDKKELIRLVRIKNSRRFRKKEKLLKLNVKKDKHLMIQQDIQIQYLKQ